EQEDPGREEEPIEAAPLGSDPTDEAAGDLADPEEHRVEAHDRPAIARELLADVGEKADCRGRRAREGEQPDAGQPQGEHDERSDEADRAQLERGMVDDCPGDDEPDAAEYPKADDRRSAVAIEAVAPPDDAAAEHDRDDDRAERDLAGLEASQEPLVRE